MKRFKLDNPRAIFAFVAELHDIVTELDTIAAEASRPLRLRTLTPAQARVRHRRARAALAQLAKAVSSVDAHGSDVR